MKEVTCDECDGKGYQTSEEKGKVILKWDCPFCGASGKRRVPDKEASI